MPYDPNSPATTHTGLSDCDKIRANTNELRKGEQAETEPANPIASMRWTYSPGTGDWIVRFRNKTNDGWIDLMRLTAAGSPKTHIETNITESVACHGIQQGSGNNFNADKVDGIHGADLAQKGKISALGEYVDNTGTEVFQANDTQKSISGISYSKFKEITLNKPPDASLKISFEMTSANVNTTCYGKIYRNGAAVGTERTVTNGTQSWTETISGWSNGDLLQIYCHVNVAAPGPAYVRNFRILGKLQIFNSLT